MKKNLIRVVLYFQKDHPISQYPQNIRNKVVKNMVERGLSTLSADNQNQDVLDEILEEIKNLKKMVSNGDSRLPPKDNFNAELSATDIDLIDQMLGLK